MPSHSPAQRFKPAECDIGDWVLASAVPEWSTSQQHQTYSPPGRGGERWSFYGSYFIDAAGDPVAIWRRVQGP